MKTRLLVTLTIGLISAALAGAGTPIQSATSDPRMPAVTEPRPAAENQADFDLMRKALEEAHTGLYRYSTRAEMDRVFAAQRAKLSRPATRPEFAAILAETPAQVRCGHTRFAPDDEMQKALANTPMFPLRMKVEGKRLVVLFNNTPDDQIVRPGMEVLEINGHKAGDILDRILPNMAADGDIETGKRARLWPPDREAKLREGMTPVPAGGYLVTAKGHPGVAEQPPGKYPFAGKVFVLIDGGTFSTAADFCAVTHHLKRATFIGEETGGGYYGNSSGVETMVTLPHSKMRIRVPMYEYWNAVPGYQGKRRGTRPDHTVETTVADLLLGADRQVELAVKLAGH